MASLNQLVQQLDSPQTTSQAAAAEQIAMLGQEAQPAIVSLVRQVASQDESVAQWCQSALEDVGPPTAGQIADLAALAKAADDNIAYWAVTLLGRAGQDAQCALSVLQERAADASTPIVQQRAEWAVGQVQG